MPTAKPYSTKTTINHGATINQTNSHNTNKRGQSSRKNAPNSGLIIPKSQTPTGKYYAPKMSENGRKKPKRKTQARATPNPKKKEPAKPKTSEPKGWNGQGYALPSSSKSGKKTAITTTKKIAPAATTVAESDKSPSNGGTLGQRPERKQTPAIQKRLKQAAKNNTRRKPDFKATAAKISQHLRIIAQLDNNIIQTAYKVALANFAQAIEAAETDPTKTPEERAALVRALRDQQQQAARTARQLAMIAEKIRVKTIKERNRNGQGQGIKTRYPKPQL